MRVLATGGLGGVHRGAQESFDESADLPILSTTPITVVSAGVKSILDIGATLERLETLSVAVVGYRTNTFPAFWLRESAFSLEWRVEEASEIAAIMGARDDLDQQGGILVANPARSMNVSTPPTLSITSPYTVAGKTLIQETFR